MQLIESFTDWNELPAANLHSMQVFLETPNPRQNAEKYECQFALYMRALAAAPQRGWSEESIEKLRLLATQSILLAFSCSLKETSNYPSFRLPVII